MQIKEPSYWVIREWFEIPFPPQLISLSILLLLWLLDTHLVKCCSRVLKVYIILFRFSLNCFFPISLLTQPIASILPSANSNLIEGPCLTDVPPELGWKTDISLEASEKCKECFKKFYCQVFSFPPNSVSRNANRTSKKFCNMCILA